MQSKIKTLSNISSTFASRALGVPRVRVYFARARVFESTRSLVLMERTLE